MSHSASSPRSPSRQDHTELGVLLRQMGPVIFSTETISTTIELVTSLASEAIPGAAGTGVTLIDDRGRRSMAASNSLVERADALQYESPRML